MYRAEKCDPHKRLLLYSSSSCKYLWRLQDQTTTTEDLPRDGLSFLLRSIIISSWDDQTSSIDNIPYENLIGRFTSLV